MKLFDCEIFSKEKFREMAPKSESQQELRKMEMTMLRPRKLQQYTGEEPSPKASHPVKSRTVKIVLRTDHELELFKKHFGIRNYVEQNAREIDKLAAILVALEEGVIRYDAQNKSIVRTTPGTKSS